MTIFRSEQGPCKNADDIKVLLVGVVCTIFIFSVVSVLDGVTTQTLAHVVDLVQNR